MAEEVNTQHYKGDNKLILGIVLGVVTFWLFAQSLLNVVPELQRSFHSNIGTISIAVSITALFSGMFVVGAGSLADKIGRVRVTYIGLWLSIIGSLLIISTNIPLFLILGRIIQGLFAAAIMPATLAIMKAYYEGKSVNARLAFGLLILGWLRISIIIWWHGIHIYRLALDIYTINYHCINFNVAD